MRVPLAASVTSGATAVTFFRRMVFESDVHTRTLALAAGASIGGVVAVGTYFVRRARDGY